MAVAKLVMLVPLLPLLNAESVFPEAPLVDFGRYSKRPLALDLVERLDERADV